MLVSIKSIGKGLGSAPPDAVFIRNNRDGSVSPPSSSSSGPAVQQSISPESQHRPESRSHQETRYNQRQNSGKTVLLLMFSVQTGKVLPVLPTFFFKEFLLTDEYEGHWAGKKKNQNFQVQSGMWKQELVVEPWTGECGSGSWCDSELLAGMHDCRWFQRRFQATFSSSALPFLLPSRLRPPTLPH